MIGRLEVLLQMEFLAAFLAMPQLDAFHLTDDPIHDLLFPSPLLLDALQQALVDQIGSTGNIN